MRVLHLYMRLLENYHSKQHKKRVIISPRRPSIMAKMLQF